MQFKSTHQNVSGSDGDALDLISKEMTMRGLKRSRSEPANFLCASASVVYNQELVFDNFSSTQMAGLWTPSIEDKLIGCINQINNKGQDMWSVIKEKMEEKGVKGFTTRQLENKYKSLKRKRSCSQDLKTHIECTKCLKCGGYARDASSINPILEFMRILNTMFNAKEIGNKTYDRACMLCATSKRFVSVFISMRDCLRKAFLGRALKHLMKDVLYPPKKIKKHVL